VITRRSGVEFRVFYSWQGDLPGRETRAFIQDELKAVIKELKTDETVLVDTILDRDTAGVPGSPDIGRTIFDKIDAAGAFVGDVSIVNPAVTPTKKTPNPNVLLELGYAFSALGESKVLMIMNTAFGAPEDLPFDLKQKRVMKYKLAPGADKGDARVALRDQLRVGVRAIVDAHQRDIRVRAPAAPDRAAEVLKAVEGNLPIQDVAAKRFMEALAADIAILDTHASPRDPGDNLLRAIDATGPIVDDFGRVAQSVAEMKSAEGLGGLVRGFEHILARYQYQGGAGSFRPTDFDLFKIVGHELAAVLAGHLIRAERWRLLQDVIGERIHMADPRGARQVGIERLSANSTILDGMSAAKGRVSFHADVLKERHEKKPPIGGLAFEDFIAGDLFLCLGTHRDGAVLWWYPRSAIYLPGRTPRFLSATTELAGAKNLTAAIGETDPAVMKARVTSAMDDLLKGLRGTGVWSPDVFDPLQILSTR
jgi:hypothetical protein